jgi:hypothetical protein
VACRQRGFNCLVTPAACFQSVHGMSHSPLHYQRAWPVCDERPSSKPARLFAQELDKRHAELTRREAVVLASDLALGARSEAQDDR